MIGTLPYAFVLGLIAAVNPCGFPLLPAYLALFVGGPERAGLVARTARGLVCGVLVTAGFVVVFGVAGALVDTGTWLLDDVPGLMVGVSLLVAVLGARILCGATVPIRLPTVRFAKGDGALAIFGFGAAYGVASLTCALPLFLAAIVSAFTRSGVLAAALNVAAFAFGMGVFVLGASVVAVHAGAPALRRLRHWGVVVPRLGGAILLLAGLYLGYYWVMDMVDAAAAPLPTRLVADVQTFVSGTIASMPWLVAGLAGALTVAAFGIVAWAHRSTVPRGREEPDGE